MPTGAGRRVLFVEDDDLISEFVKEQLVVEGHQVTIVKTVVAAADRLASEGFDAIALAAHLAEDKLEAIVHNWKTLDPFARIVLMAKSPPHPRPPEIHRVVARPFDMEDFRDAIFNPFAVV